MSAIHFIGGEKGGVGKSVLARVLAQYMLDRDLPFAALDADTSHGALLRFYGEFAQAIDLEQVESADQIMDRALGSDRRVLVDLPAQSARHLLRWIQDGDVLTLARETSVRLVFWHVSDGGFDSVKLLSKTLSELGDRVEYVLVKNEGRGKSFGALEASDAVKHLHHLGGKIHALPELDGATMGSIDHSGGSFWAATHHTEGALALPHMQRQRAKLWLQRAFAMVDQVGV